jgi:hypothetical protein
MDNPWGGGMVFILFPNFFQEDFVLCLRTRRDNFLTNFFTLRIVS